MAQKTFLEFFVKQLEWKIIEKVAEKGSELLIADFLVKSLLQLTLPPVVSGFIVDASKLAVTAGVQAYKEWTSEQEGQIRYTPTMLSSGLVQLNATSITGSPPLWMPRKQTFSYDEHRQPWLFNLSSTKNQFNLHVCPKCHSVNSFDQFICWKCDSPLFRLNYSPSVRSAVKSPVYPLTESINSICPDCGGNCLHWFDDELGWQGYCFGCKKHS